MTIQAYPTSAGTKFRAYVYVLGKLVDSKRGFSRKSDAKTWCEKVKLHFQNNSSVGKQEEYSFDDLVENFVNIHLEKKRFNTKRRYLEDINLRLEPYFKNRLLGTIKSREIEKLQINLRQGKLGFRYSIKSVNECISLLKMMLNKAVEWEMLTKNPALFIKPLKPEEAEDDNQTYQWWEKYEDAVKFLKVAKGYHLYEFYYTALNTGMRLSELIGLDRDNVDLESGIIKVRFQFPRKVGRLVLLKTKESRRDIRMSPLLIKIIKEAILKSSHPTAVFSSKDGNRVNERSANFETWNRIIKKAKILRITFHGLRHTFASHYMLQGGNIWDLRQILGHASVKQTEQYAHLSPLHVRPSVVSFEPCGMKKSYHLGLEKNNEKKSYQNHTTTLHRTAENADC